VRDACATRARDQRGLPGSKLRQAIEYMTSNWKELTRFLTKPKAPLTNNAAERSLRGPPTIDVAGTNRLEYCCLCLSLSSVSNCAATKSMSMAEDGLSDAAPIHQAQYAQLIVAPTHDMVLGIL
jgi:hypothetical protein